jgi:hypothetical protein
MSKQKTALEIVRDPEEKYSYRFPAAYALMERGEGSALFVEPNLNLSTVWIVRGERVVMPTPPMAPSVFTRY